ncbi:UbiH/UbiF family hydroxylase, partial [Rhizobium sp. TRM95111]|uniref:UbiH/UbiF family hydroxylase n=1 Tax=Rhizobium alarense TaxID=2846851 RepID=UPI001F3CDB7D
MEKIDIAVVGAGLAGSLAALALAGSGRRVALVAPESGGSDGRTTALMDPSIGFLKTMGLWDAIAPEAAALETMRILDGTARLLRAPPVSFRSSEVGLAAFGYNIPNAPLIGILAGAVAGNAAIDRVSAALAGLSEEADGMRLALSDGRTLQAALVVGADGRQSKVREASGIGLRKWSYPQAALVVNFAHDRPHDGISTEFHTENGPFTQVPLPGRRSSLVWVMAPDAADEMKARDLPALAAAIERRMQSMLGRVAVEAPPQVFPLSGMMADRFGEGRVALVGEAAHAFPPIGAQGLNLSLRDVFALRDLVAEGSGIGPDIGDRFSRRRQVDVRSRTASVDLLNRSLLSGLLPVQVARSAGLHLLSAIGPLRSLVMREGIEPGGALRA